MNNTAYNVDFTRLLPEPLKSDATMMSLGKAIADELQENIRLAKLAIIYPRIDELDETTLDILARDLRVDWYDDTYPVEAKRNVIKSSVLIHKRLGTKFAVVSAVGDIFPQSKVQEWFEYGGEPYHFKIIVSGSTLSGQEVVRNKIQYVKNLRSVLDEIRFIIDLPPSKMFTGIKNVGINSTFYGKAESRSDDIFTSKSGIYHGISIVNNKKVVFGLIKHTDNDMFKSSSKSFSGLALCGSRIPISTARLKNNIGDFTESVSKNYYSAGCVSKEKVIGSVQIRKGGEMFKTNHKRYAGIMCVKTYKKISAKMDCKEDSK